MVPNPQLDLFETDDEEQSVLAAHLWNLQEGILAPCSKQKPMSHSAEIAEDKWALTQHSPLVMEYSWQWPSHTIMGGAESPQPGAASESFSSMENLYDRISNNITSALSQPCPVFSDDHSTRVEFLDCIAWVISSKHRAVFLEVRGADGKWKMSRIKFNMADPLGDTLWLDQVLLPWVPQIERAFGIRAVEVHWQLRRELECKFHRADFLSATSRQISYHLKPMPVLDRVCKHICKWDPEFELDNEIVSNFWAEEPVWSNLANYYPHLIHLYHTVREEGLIKPESGLSGFRAMCLQLGMSRAGWRFLSRFGELAYEGLEFQIIEYGLSTAELLAFIDWQARAGLDTPLPGILGERVIVADCIKPDNCGQLSVQVDPRLARVAFAYLDQALEDDTLDGFVDNEWLEVLMWIHRERPTFDRNQWHAGWPAIHNSFVEWSKNNHNNLSWSPILESFVFDQWRVRPLTSSSELVEEGIRMDHCVGSYDKFCFEEDGRIFTVENATTKEPVATIGIKNTSDGWVLDQVMGKRNHNPRPEMLVVAELIREKLNAITGESPAT